MVGNPNRDSEFFRREIHRFIANGASKRNSSRSRKSIQPMHSGSFRPSIMQLSAREHRTGVQV